MTDYDYDQLLRQMRKMRARRRTATRNLYRRRSKDMTHNDPNLDFAETGMKLRVFSDGTHTIAQLVFVEDDGREIIAGEGTARRRSGDTRNFQHGVSLSVRRAYAAAAEAEEDAFPLERM